MSNSCRDDIVIRLLLLKHHPHCLDVVACKAPVPFRIEIAHPQFCGQTKFDTGNAMADFTGYKFFAAPGAFMVEQNTGYSKEIVAFAVVDSDVMAVSFCSAIGASWMKRRQLVLRHFPNFTEHFTARCLIEFCFWADLPHSFQHPGYADTGEFTRERWLGP